MPNGIRIWPPPPLTGAGCRPFFRVMSKVGKVEDFSSEEFDVTVCWDQKWFTALTGSEVPIRKARGYRFESEFGPVIPVYPFEYYNAEGRKAPMDMSLCPVTIWDFLTAFREVQRVNDPPQFPMGQLTLEPNATEFQRFCDGAGWSEFVAWDIETPRRPKGQKKKAGEDDDEEDLDEEESVFHDVDDFDEEEEEIDDEEE